MMNSVKPAKPTPAETISASSSPPVPCWSCKGPVASGRLFCDTCDAVQPPARVDHFQRLNLPRSFDVDGAKLERGYFEGQRLLHPDRFATRSTRERALSIRQAASLNEAYETLKDPLKRADYLCRLERIGVSAEDPVNDTGLLMETMEMREALSEAETLDDVTACLVRAGADIARCVDDISAAFGEADIERAAHLTTRLKYLRKLAEEARERRAKIKRAS